MGYRIAAQPETAFPAPPVDEPVVAEAEPAPDEDLPHAGFGLSGPA